MAPEELALPPPEWQGCRTPAHEAELRGQCGPALRAPSFPLPRFCWSHSVCSCPLGGSEPGEMLLSTKALKLLAQPSEYQRGFPALASELSPKWAEGKSGCGAGGQESRRSSARPVLMLVLRAQSPFWEVPDNFPHFESFCAD